MKYIIVDLEATCFLNDRSKRQEIIEIGAVMVNEKVEIEGTFQTFIQPVLNPKLSDFCRELTSITQEDVDAAPLFVTGLNRFFEWIGDKNHEGKMPNVVFCSWGFYDKTQFISDCELHGIKSDWIENHISLKHQFMENRKQKKCGMVKALRLLSLPLLGTHHRGLDDAKNIANIFIKIFPEWKFK